MVYKTEKLRSRIKEKFGDQKKFAEAIGINESTLSRCLNEGREWKGSNMMKAVKALKIPSSDIESYFFEPAVEETQPQKA